MHALFTFLAGRALSQAQTLDIDEVYLEIESNFRIGAQVIAWDGDSCREEFNSKQFQLWKI